MDNSANLLSTPQGYATPDQIKSIYDYSQALLHGTGQQPVRSWEQGVSNMISALVGGNMNYEAGQRERLSQLHDAGAKVAGLEGTGAFANDQFAKNNNPDAAASAARAIASQESGGQADPYKAIGPVTKTGDRAYGKYQVMGTNIPQWTKEALGRSYTPEQFLHDPQAQEAVFKTKFLNDYVPKYGYDGAARAWFGGEGGMNNPNASDVNGQTVSGYANAFDKSFSNPTAQAITAALRGGSSSPQPQAAPPSGTQGASGGVGPANVQPVTARSAAPPYYPEPDGSAGKPYINPALIHSLTNYNEQNLTDVMASQWLPANEREEAFHQTMMQGQPVAIPYMGGAVLINRRNPSAQQFIPNVTWQTKKIGDITVPFAAIPDGRGGIYEAPVGHPGAGAMQGAGAPTAAPTVAPQAAPAQPPAPIQANAQSPSAAPTGSANATANGPVQVASLNPTAGVKEAAEEEGKGGGVTPAAMGAPPTPPANAPLTQLSANDDALKSFVGPEAWQAYQQMKNYNIQQGLNEEAGKKQTDLAFKKYDTLSTQAMAARKLIPNLELAQALVNDPRFHGGILAGPQDVVARLKAGLLGDQNANAPNEAFDKLMSGAVLDTMRTALGGLGQVRMAEIQLLQRANANRYNTPASNRAVIDISLRAMQQLDRLDGMAQQYVSGGEVDDPITGKMLVQPNIVNGQIQQRRGLDVGFDKVARDFINTHPTLSKDDIKNYEQLFSNKPTEGAQGAQTGAPQIGTQKVFSDGKGGTVTGVWDGQKYVPQNQYKPAAPAR